MKLICLILSLYVITLSAKPCCADYDCQGKTTARKELASKSPVKEKGECPGCSPFFTCGSCVGFVVYKPITINFSIVSETSVTYHATYKQPYIEKISLSIWLPPKIS